MNTRDDITKFKELCRQRAIDRVQKLSSIALKTLVNTTPVDTGTAKGNWRVELDKMTRSYATDSNDSDGQSTISTGAAMILSAKLGQEIIISNHVPYIVRLEYGHSQKNAHMMKQTENILRAVITNKQL